MVSFTTIFSTSAEAGREADKRIPASIKPQSSFIFDPVASILPETTPKKVAAAPRRLSGGRPAHLGGQGMPPKTTAATAAPYTRDINPRRYALRIPRRAIHPTPAGS